MGPAGWATTTLRRRTHVRPEEAIGVLFPTMTFALFFVVVLGVSWKLIDRPVQWKLFVLAASYMFYGWADWKFCFLLAGSTVGNWLVAMALARARDDRARRAWMALGVVGNLALLGFFKYYGFFVDSVLAALQPLGLAPTALLVQIALPVGISFFTFCAISYMIDVYRDEQEPVTLLDFAVYLAFFPHLVAGPIVRVSEFEPQLRRRRNPDTIDATRAARLICRGLFKKVVIANYLATAIVDPVFLAPVGAHQLGAAGGGLGVRGADLRRLLGLHRHRDRHRPADGHQVPGQLRPALLARGRSRSSGAAGT